MSGKTCYKTYNIYIILYIYIIKYYDYNLLLQKTDEKDEKPFFTNCNL